MISEYEVVIMAHMSVLSTIEKKFDREEWQLCQGHHFQ